MAAILVFVSVTLLLFLMGKKEFKINTKKRNEVDVLLESVHDDKKHPFFIYSFL